MRRTWIAGALAAVSHPGITSAQGLMEQFRNPGVSGFGRSVSSAGDMDADGHGDIALGHGWNNSQGRVEVYSGDDFQLMYAFHGLSSNHELGRAIESVGDIDGDGHDDLALGSPGASRAIVVSGANGDTIRQWVGLPNGTGLGTAIANLGDVQGDGVNDIAVSASGFGPGRVFVFSGLDGSILREHVGFVSSQAFGDQLDGGADADGDGIGDLLIATLWNGSLPRVYLYSGASGALLRTYSPPNPQTYFPDGIALVPDADGDQLADVAIGASDDDTAWSNAGAVRIHSSATGQVVRTMYGGPHDGLGKRLERLSDADGDGIADLLASSARSNLVPSYVALYSGANGAELQRVRSAAEGLGGLLAALPDIDLDGHPEFLTQNLPSSSSDVRILLVTTGTAAGTSTCTAKTDSIGCQPAIGAVGTPSLSGADDFHVTCAQVQNNKAGLLFWGRLPASASFGGGTLCITAPVIRTPVQSSGGSPSGANCSGAFDHHFSNAYMQLKGVEPGSWMQAQYWSRDPGFQAPNNISLSNAWTWIVSL
jgi:hypothetical protein